jgi:hypothetical protein
MPCPPAPQFSAIEPPIIPNPMKPTRIVSSPRQFTILKNASQNHSAADERG